MGEKDKRGLASLDLSPQKEEEIFTRCFTMVDYLNEAAIEIIMDFLHNTSCPLAKQVLRNSPETIAIKSFEKAINTLSNEIRRKDLQIQ